MKNNIYKCDDGQDLKFYRAGRWIFISGDYHDWVHDISTGETDFSPIHKFNDITELDLSSIDQDLIDDIVEDIKFDCRRVGG